MFFPKLIVQKDPNSEPSSSPEAVVFIPLDVDLSLHAVPALTLLFDFMFLEHKFSKKESRYLAPLIVLISAASYGSWVEYCAKFNGTCMLFSWFCSCYRHSEFTCLQSPTPSSRKIHSKSVLGSTLELQLLHLDLSGVSMLCTPNNWARIGNSSCTISITWCCRSRHVEAYYFLLSS